MVYERNINGKIVKFYTISDLAVSAGKTKYAIKKLEDRGIIPAANYRTEPKFIDKRQPGVSANEYNEYFLVCKRVKRGEASIEVLENAIALGQVMEGYRIYSEYIFDELVDILKGIRRGVEVDFDTKSKMIELFKKEVIIISNL